MAKVKLFGLVLIITTSLLALAAISTQTTLIRIRRFTSSVAIQNAADSENTTQVSTGDSVDFVSIPIALPLCFTGLLGMLLWFTPVHSKPSRLSSRRGSHRNRR